MTIKEKLEKMIDDGAIVSVDYIDKLDTRMDNIAANYPEILEIDDTWINLANLGGESAFGLRYDYDHDTWFFVIEFGINNTDCSIPIADLDMSISIGDLYETYLIAPYEVAESYTWSDFLGVDIKDSNGNLM